MYKQNASRDTCFEALIVRVPWPQWIDELERSRFDNAKFLPVTFVDRTAGYDSECAVLFPETFSTAEPPSDYHFGAIFCDREAERFRRVCGAAAEQLRLNLPPDAACLLRSAELSESAYMLWDLIHDRTHMRGDLPFDPFMIRQRSPYWMYSLEELRCDLTAFATAVELEREGFALRPPRPVRDPLRPPLPLPDHRLAGAQLRRARRPAPVRLPAQGGLPALDRQPADDRLGPGRRRRRRACASRVQELYHSGIDRSKLGQWIAAHDLVADYVPPAESSVWADRTAAICPRSKSRSSSSTWSATTSSRSASSTPSCGPKLERALERPRADGRASSSLLARAPLARPPRPPPRCPCAHTCSPPRPAPPPPPPPARPSQDLGQVEEHVRVQADELAIGADRHPLAGKLFRLVQAAPAWPAAARARRCA